MYLSALQTQIPGHFSKWLLLPTPVRLACYNCSKSVLTDTLPFRQHFLPSKPSHVIMPMGLSPTAGSHSASKKGKWKPGALPWVTERVPSKVSIRFLDASSLHFSVTNVPQLRLGIKYSVLSVTPTLPQRASLKCPLLSAFLKMPPATPPPPG